MNHSFLKPNSQSQPIVDLLCANAKRGLANCYCPKDICQPSQGLDNFRPRLNMVLNLRYIIIAQIGIKRWLTFHNNDYASLPDLWGYIFSRRHDIKSAGDLALAVWAGAESDFDDCCCFVEKLVNNWPKLRNACNAMELAWVIQAMVRFSQCQPLSYQTTALLNDAHNKLMNLHCHDSGLFARHHRKGLKSTISRHIACFADQVYPILALANYGHHFQDTASLDAAAAASDTICHLQGPEGQWWWHYDTKTATVAEQYPVFSVHQDAMAPMALLAIDQAVHTDHTPYIERGLIWLTGQNELTRQMTIPEQGVIYRDIHRREIAKAYRIIRNVSITTRLHTVHRLTGRNFFGYTINRECRPYHLGWILYTWAEKLAKTGISASHAENKAKLIKSS